ncbi:MAG: biotin/lipoyl-containing protein [Promethearchaeota archaeon]
MTRKYKLTVNSKIVDVEVEGPINGILIVTIGETSFPVQIKDGDTQLEKFDIKVGNVKHTISLTPNPNTSEFTIKINKETYTAFLARESVTPSRSIRAPTITTAPTSFTPSTQPSTEPPQESAEPGTVTAPLPGRVLEVCVKEADVVKLGDVLLVLEAMKMANEIRAPQDGTVKHIHVEAGTAVEKGQPMISFQ